VQPDAWVADRGNYPWPREGVFGARRLLVPGSRGATMKNPLDSLMGTVISGLVITLVLYVIVKVTEGAAT
jgi:hypothetical protein